MPSKKKAVSEHAVLHRKLIELWKRGQSRYCEVRDSEIHGRGVYATSFIPKGTKIIEYVGELVDRRRASAARFPSMPSPSKRAMPPCIFSH